MPNRAEPPDEGRFVPGGEPHAEIKLPPLAKPGAHLLASSGHFSLVVPGAHLLASSGHFSSYRSLGVTSFIRNFCKIPVFHLVLLLIQVLIEPFWTYSSSGRGARIKFYRDFPTVCPWEPTVSAYCRADWACLGIGRQGAKSRVLPGPKSKSGGLAYR
jgi:hypothetical protein